MSNNVVEVKDRQEYERLWTSAGLTLFQSWAWGEVKAGEGGVFRGRVGDLPYSIFIKKFPAIKKRFGYMPRPFSEAGVLADQLKAIADHAIHSLRLTHLLVDPRQEKGSFETEFAKAGFQRSGKTIQPNYTNVIDLSRGEEPVFADMSSNFRKKIRRAVKHGCTVEELSYDSPQSVDRFFNFMSAIYARTSYVMFGKKYFKKIWEELKPEKKVRILVVRQNKEDIGGIMYFYDNEWAYEMYGGTLDKGRSIMANYLLKWEGMKLAMKLGKSRYDQWGVAKKTGETYDQRDPLCKISEFKQGFGGKYVELMPQQVYMGSGLYYYMYRLGLVLNKVLMFPKRIFHR